MQNTPTDQVWWQCVQQSDLCAIRQTDYLPRPPTSSDKPNFACR